MTLAEALTLLHGKPVGEAPVDGRDIPCLEKSDSGALCKTPVVSVYMITYNHASYIRRAIEGVVTQRADFPFELVIGEDCSSDETRDICFQMQQCYPDKIRVLYGVTNVGMEQNGRRTMARCRGEYVAYCEGDDYWMDPYKLRKQVDAMHRHNAVMCVGSSEWHYPDGGVKQDVYCDREQVIGVKDCVQHYFHTSTYLVNRQVLESCQRVHFAGIPIWYDTVLLVCMASEGTVVCLPDVLSVYNWTGNGAGGGVYDYRRKVLIAEQCFELAWMGPSACRAHYAREALAQLLNMYQFPNHHAIVSLDRLMAVLFLHCGGSFSSGEILRAVVMERMCRIVTRMANTVVLGKPLKGWIRRTA